MFKRFAGIFFIVAGVAWLSACAPTPEPVVEAPPPPPPPPRPEPPRGSVENMTIPPVDPYGTRQTVNTNLANAETVWNFRSAFNVAALNCAGPQFLRIADDYNSFLTSNKRKLDRVNREVESSFRQQYGSGAARVRDTYMTQVYNYFALPPVTEAFCAEALLVAQESTLVAPEDLETFSARALGRFEAVFAQFFDEYDAYRRRLAAWEAQYGPNVEVLRGRGGIGTPDVVADTAPPAFSSYPVPEQRALPTISGMDNAWAPASQSATGAASQAPATIQAPAPTLAPVTGTSAAPAVTAAPTVTPSNVVGSGSSGAAEWSYGLPEASSAPASANTASGPSIQAQPLPVDDATTSGTASPVIVSEPVVQELPDSGE